MGCGFIVLVGFCCDVDIGCDFVDMVFEGFFCFDVLVVEFGFIILIKIII